MIDGALLIGAAFVRGTNELPRDTLLPAERRLVPILGDGILLVEPTRDRLDGIPFEAWLLDELLPRLGGAPRKLEADLELPIDMPPREVLIAPRDVLKPPLMLRLFDPPLPRNDILPREVPRSERWPYVGTSIATHASARKAAMAHRQLGFFASRIGIS